jgi:hypothetical protein
MTVGSKYVTVVLLVGKMLSLGMRRGAGAEVGSSSNSRLSGSQLPSSSDAGGMLADILRLIDPRGSSEGERVVVETTFDMMSFGEMLRKKGRRGSLNTSI